MPRSPRLQAHEKVGDVCRLRDEGELLDLLIRGRLGGDAGEPGPASGSGASERRSTGRGG